MSKEEIKPGTVFTPRFHKFFESHKRMMWDMSKISYDQVDPNLVSDQDVAGVRAAMLVESHNPVYTEVLLRKFRRDQEMSAFVVVWGYEELQHYGSLKTYLESLEASGRVDRAALKALLDQTRAGPWGEEEAYFKPARSFVHTMLQEQVTGMYYRNFARGIKEPVLKETLHFIEKDEFRHCQWYFDKAKEAIEENPKVMPEIDEGFKGFDMPGGSFVPNYDQERAIMRESAQPQRGDYLEVFKKAVTLVGPVHATELAFNSSFRDAILERWGVDLSKVVREIVGQSVVDGVKSRLPFFSIGPSK